MFSLEQSIADWRRQMLAAGIKTPVPLEELEIHLREEIEQQIKSGLNEQKAFEISVRQIGHPNALKSEFKKSERRFMKQIVKIGAGIIGVLVGMAFIMPAAAQCRHEGVMTKDDVVLYTFGMGVCFASVMLALLSLKKRKA
jgi:hypothetical protein